MPLGTPTAPTPVVGNGTVDTLTTASFTPAPSSLLFACLSGRRDQTMAESTIDDSLGLTWTSLISNSFDAGSGIRLRQRIYVTAIGVSPSLMTVTHNNTNSIRMGVNLIAITGTLSLPTNIASNYDANNDPAPSLPIAPAAGSTLLGFACLATTSSQPFTPPTGFTELEDQQFAGTANLQIQSCYDAGGGAQANAWTAGGANGAWATVIEIVAPALARSVAMVF